VIHQKDASKFIGTIRPYRGDPESHYLLGCYLQERKKHKQAVEEFIKSVEIEPTHAKAYNGMGVSYDSLGEYAKAIEAYKSALKMDPKLDYVHNNLGYAYLLDGDLNSAIDSFKQAVALNNRKERYHNNLGLAYAMSGKYNLALDEFKLAVGENRAHASLAKIIGQNGLYDRAASKFAAVPMIRPSDRTNNEVEAAKTLANIFAGSRPVSAQPNEEQVVPESRYESAAPFAAAPMINPSDMPNNSIEAAKTLANIFADARTLSTRNEVKVVPESQDRAAPQFAGALMINPSDGSNRVEAADNLTEIFPVMQPMRNKIEEIVLEPQHRDAGRQAASGIKIEVSNGNGVNRMARRVGEFLRGKGFLPSRLTNAENFNQLKTRIYYSRGYQDQACKIASYLPEGHSIEMVQRPPKRNEVIRVVIGKDLAPYRSLFQKS